MNRIGYSVALASVALLQPVQVQAQAGKTCGGSEPYGVTRRPLPAGLKIANVLPAKVGKFVREAVPAGTNIPSNEDYNVTYKSGGDRIFVGLSRPGSLKDLQEGVRVTRQEAVADPSIDRKGEVFCLGKDISFYKLTSFYSWTRGDYFLYAQGNNAAALDAFMAAFPH